jgi:hypothetical protein
MPQYPKRLIEVNMPIKHIWRLAQALSALHLSHTEEKCRVDGVLARKKGLGL